MIVVDFSQEPENTEEFEKFKKAVDSLTDEELDRLALTFVGMAKDAEQC